MRPTPFRVLAGRLTVAAVSLILVTISTEVLSAKDAPKVGLATSGAVIPGGAVISAAVSSVSSLGGQGGGAAAASYAATGLVILTPPGEGEPVMCDLAEDGTFSFKGLKPGRHTLRILMNTTVAKQTQGATFGEKVNQGMATAAPAKARHDTAKNSIGNIRARTDGTEEKPAVEESVNNINGGMPNRISMNVTVPKQNLTASEDGESVLVQVGADGTLTGRASLQQSQGAEPASSNKGRPKGEAPPRPAGG